MTESRPDLPDFTSPPVVEVALSVQFNSIEKFRTTHIGLLWERFRKEFPLIEEHAPRESVIEQFERTLVQLPELKVEVMNLPPVPRVWFLNEMGTELVQIQQDRFVHNWRKRGAKEEYPRYESIKNTFVDEVESFVDFLNSEDLGNLIPNQCEITYVNHIYSDREGNLHPPLDEVVTVWNSEYSDDFLGLPEDSRFQARYLIRDATKKSVGRLHINAEPRFKIDDGSPVLVLTLTARGFPQGKGLDGVISFLDLGREWIVKGFTSITTKKIHETWGRNK